MKLYGQTLTIIGNMKVCIEWRKNFRYLPQADEFNINYKENKSKKLLEFLDIYTQSQRVNIRVDRQVSKNDVELLDEIYKMGYDIAILFETAYPENIPMQSYKELSIPFFFGTAVNNWDRLNELIELGVSDIYITGDICFDLKRIAAYVPENIHLRCFVNLCQYEWDNSEGLKTFFIRPEDVDFYGGYIDVFEFFNSVEEQSTLYEIYFHDKEWNGNLREIIKGLKRDLNSYYILGNEFGKTRVNCQRKCIKGGSCRMCDRLAEFADSLEKSPDYEVFKRRMIDGKRSFSETDSI